MCWSQANIANLVMTTAKEISSDEEVDDENGSDGDSQDGPAMLPFDEEIQDIVRRGVEEGVNPVGFTKEGVGALSAQPFTDARSPGEMRGDAG